MTLLKGTWMWGSLLALPLIVAVTILVLQRLDNRQLRRALQFAVILSMALHILIMVLASVTHLFGKEHTTVAEQSIKRPNKVILISKQNQPKIWEQTTKHEVPEPEVEVEKQATTTDMTSQPVPVKTNSKNRESQIAKTAERSQTVPRFDESLSKLSSNTDSRRKSNTRTMPMTSEKVAENSNQPSPTATKSESTPSDSVAAKRESESQSAAAAPEKTANPKTSAQKVRKTAERRSAENPNTAADSPTRSTARIRSGGAQNANEFDEIGSQKR